MMNVKGGWLPKGAVIACCLIFATRICFAQESRPAADVGPDSHEVTQVVLASLRDPTPQEREQILALFKAGAGQDDQECDAAIREIRARFYRFGTWMRRRSIDLDQPLTREEQQRWAKIFAPGGALHEEMKVLTQAGEFAHRKSLTGQPEYLVGLLRKAQGADRDAVARQLAKVTGKDHPMAFAFEYGKGRVFHTPLGHDVRGIRKPGVSELIRRGTAWAAKLEPR